jgi:hypothetical protein
MDKDKFFLASNINKRRSARVAKKDIFPKGTPDNLQKVYFKYCDQLQKYPNVIATGIGEKEVDGQLLEPAVPAIVVIVTNKIKNMDAKDCIPSILDGTHTDVVGTGGGIVPA